MIDLFWNYWREFSVCYGRKAKQGGTLNGVLSKAEFGSLNFVVDVDIGIASALVWDYLLRREVDL